MAGRVFSAIYTKAYIKYYKTEVPMLSCLSSCLDTPHDFFNALITFITTISACHSLCATTNVINVKT